jgi:hypothetical protein
MADRLVRRDELSGLRRAARIQMEMLVGGQEQDCVGLLVDPVESTSLLPSIGSGREFCLFVVAEATVLAASGCGCVRMSEGGRGFPGSSALHCA